MKKRTAFLHFPLEDPTITDSKTNDGPVPALWIGFIFPIHLPIMVSEFRIPKNTKKMLRVQCV